MKVGGKHFRTIWPSADGHSVDIIDQRWLPHDFRIETVGTVDGIATAIRDMWVRGAPLIGVAAAYPRFGIRRRFGPGNVVRVRIAATTN